MSDSSKLLAQRDLGQYPLSIATSMAIEALRDVHPDIPPRTPKTATHYDQLWVNLRTLYRNLMGALPRGSRGRCSPEDVWDYLLQETVQLTRIVGEAGVEVVFYRCDYRNLQQVFPDAKLAVPSTKLQRFDHDYEEAVFALNKNPDRYRRFNWKVEAGQGERGKRVLMLTHYPTDLLSRYEFAELSLLESHTGVIKPHTQFNTKLKDRREDFSAPFNLFTLQVFGDGGRLFMMQDPALRDYVAKLGFDGRWTVMTTLDKIKSAITKAKDETWQGLATRLARA